MLAFHPLTTISPRAKISSRACLRLMDGKHTYLRSGFVITDLRPVVGEELLRRNQFPLDADFGGFFLNPGKVIFHLHLDAPRASWRQ
jgi:hypothetical protein